MKKKLCIKKNSLRKKESNRWEERMKVLKGYKFRMYPTEEQKQFFIETFGCVRFTYNHLLVERQHHLQWVEEESLITPASLKKDYPFLKKTDSLALSNAQRNLDRAFKNYFSGRAGYPKLKTKKDPWQSYTTNNQKHTIYFDKDKVKLPKLKSLIAVHQHRSINGKIKSATISAKENKEFYISILCVEEVFPLTKTHQSVGIAYCPNQLLELSQNLCVSELNQHPLEKKMTREKHKLQVRARVAKKRKVRLENAKNYQKQKQKVEVLLKAKRDQKKDFIDQLTYQLVANYDQLFIENDPVFSEELAITFSETDWQFFLYKIQYKADWYGKKVTFVSLANTLQKNKSREIEKIGLQINNL